MAKRGWVSRSTTQTVSPARRSASASELPAMPLPTIKMSCIEVTDSRAWEERSRLQEPEAGTGIGVGTVYRATCFGFGFVNGLGGTAAKHGTATRLRRVPLA